MAKFLIEKLTVSGEGNEPSVIEFKEGLNLLVGDSNTGKTLVIECINYLLGFKEEKRKPPFRLNKDFGFDQFELVVRTANGVIVFKRKRDATKIFIDSTSTDPNFEVGAYSIDHTTAKNINAIWLRLMGIEKPHQILATQNGAKNALTVRAMLHMFLIEQDYSSRPTSVFLKPGNYLSDPPSKAIMLFLMTGQDADKEETQDDKRIRAAKRTAIVEYINDTLSRLYKREKDVLNQQGEGNIDFDEVISAVKNEITAVQVQITDAIAQSRQLMERIYEYNGRLSECETIAERFAILRGQYDSDIERLTLIFEGCSHSNDLPENKTCPFCDGEIEKQDEPLYLEAVRADLSHIRIHLTELEKAERDVESERVGITNGIRQLEAQKETVDALVSDDLTPRLTLLQTRLDDYRRAVELSRELKIIQDDERFFSGEIDRIEQAAKNPNVKYDVVQYFDDEQKIKFNERLKTILEACHYEGFASARLNWKESFDLEIGGKPKSMMAGGGYCGFLNAVVALAFLEYLENYGAYSPGFLIVDSPLSQLSESGLEELSKTKREGFFNYLLSGQNIGINEDSEDSPADESRQSSDPFRKQVIIAEHPDKVPSFVIDHPDANVIVFTKDKTKDSRYGFLDGVYNE
jgi:hypothetical protein